MFFQFGRFNIIKHGFVIAALLSLVACHSGQLPNAPDLASDTSEIQSPLPSLRIALLPFTLNKPTSDQTSSQIKTKRIGVWGGLINITHEKTKATFLVPPKALNEKTEISMQMHGSGPSAIVEFGPDGLTFNHPATLALTFSAEGIDPENLGGYLVEEDGTRTEVRHKVIVRGNRITVLIQINHFSEYGTGDGENGYDPNGDPNDGLDDDEDWFDPYN